MLSTFTSKAKILLSPLILYSAIGIAGSLSITGGIPFSQAQPSPQYSLGSNRWKLTFLNGKAIPAAKYSIEPQIVFDPTAHRITGSGTCNRFIGQYSSEGTSLKLNPVATTRRMCLDQTMMELENSFLYVLTQTRSYQLTPKFLYFLDDSGKKIAQFSEKKTITP